MEDSGFCCGWEVLQIGNFYKSKSYNSDNNRIFTFPSNNMSLLFQKPEHIQKLKYNFDQYSDGKHLTGLKAIKSYFASIGLNNDLFLNDLYYYYPDLQNQSKLHQFHMSFDDCLALIDFLVSKKNNPKTNAQLLQSFKVFDKSANGIINTVDLLPMMKRYLTPKDYEQFSQIVTSSFGPTLNYLETFKINSHGKHH